MRDPLPRFSSGSASSQDSWLNRIRENLAQLLIPEHLKPSSANGAPIHLLKFDKSRRPARAQGVSLATHAAVAVGLVFFLANTSDPVSPQRNPISDEGPVTISSGLIRTLTTAPPSNAGGQGGAKNPLPATHGDPPPYSSLVLVKPSLPQHRDATVTVPPTLLDPNAAPILTPTPNIGLPWMPKDTNSGGPGPGNTIGSVGGPDAGDHGTGPFGQFEGSNHYGPGFVSAMCAYCPIPTYTDDARHVKVQGTVTLQVLVGTDGRAQDVRVVKGVGYGLDERAVETVRGWKFVPAHDGAKHAVATWVTVEAVFRLF